jgi:adenosylcobinamide-GDP ribazoletransferase
MKGLIVAIQFLTRLPTPRLTVSKSEFAASIRWFPAVGQIIGAALLGMITLTAPLGPWVSALSALLLWVGITGGLHLDGVGDIADASGAAHQSRDKLLSVLADPHIGSFGVIAIALQILSKFILIHALILADAAAYLLFIPMFARIGPLVWALFLPSLHAGLGDMFRPFVKPWLLLIWSVLSLMIAIFYPALLAAPIFFALWAGWIYRRIGGISGDGHGAGIEWSESVLLFAALIWAVLA